MVLVISQSPGFWFDCAPARAVRIAKHINAIDSRVLLIISPW
jgi:hypothetical protein